MNSTFYRLTKLRRTALFLLSLAMIAALFGTVPAVRASAASSYQVLAWDEYYHARELYHFFTIYQGTPNKNLEIGYEPTFYSRSSDLYWENEKSESGINITVYTDGAVGFGEAGVRDDEMADTFLDYLLKGVEGKTDAFVGYLGTDYESSGVLKPPSYFDNSYQRSEKLYHVVKIENWHFEKLEDIWPLINKSPFTNSNGEKLYLEFIDLGNVIKEQWDYIRNNKKCTLALTLYDKVPEEGATVGLRFEDADGNTIKRYAP